MVHRYLDFNTERVQYKQIQAIIVVQQCLYVIFFDTSNWLQSHYHLNMTHAGPFNKLIYFRYMERDPVFIMLK